MSDKPLKPRELALLDGVAAGLSYKDAALKAGYPEKSARFQASRAMSRPEMRARLAELLQAKGLGTGELLDKAKELLEARRYGLTADGRVVDLGSDGQTQQKTLDMLFKAAELYPDPRIDINTGTQNVLVIRSDQSPLAALDPFAEELGDA